MDFLTNHGHGHAGDRPLHRGYREVEQLLVSPERRGMMIQAQETFGNAHCHAGPVPADQADRPARPGG